MLSNNPILYKDLTGHFKKESETVDYEQSDIQRQATVSGGVVDKETDTLWSISKDQLESELGKGNVTNKHIKARVAQIKDVNGLKNDTIKLGQKLITGVSDKIIDEPGVEATYDEVAAVMSFAGGGAISKTAAKANAVTKTARVTSEVILKQGAKQLVLREGGQFAKQTTTNLLKGFIKAESNQARGLVTKELAKRFCVSESGEFTKGVIKGLIYYSERFRE